MMPQNRREWIVSVVSVAAIAAAVFFVWPSRATKEDPKVELDRMLIKARTPFVTVDPADASVVEESLTRSLRGEPALLTEQSRKMLLARLVDEIRCRSSREPAASVAQAAGDRSHRWITTADSKDWQVLTSFLEQRFPAGGRPTGSVEFMHGVIAGHSVGDWKDRFERLGGAVDGLRIVVSRVRTIDQLDDHLLGAFTPAEQRVWFQGQGQPALRLRVPVRTLEEVLRAEDGAIAASLAAFVRTDSGAVVNWYSHWYWEPTSGQWMCHGMYRKGRNVLILF